MAKIPGSVQVTGFFAPTDDKDTFGVSDPRWGIGGYSTWPQWAEILSIPAGRRRLGMLVYNQNIDAADVNNGIYQLISNPVGDVTTNVNWASLATGGGSGGSLHQVWASGIDYIAGDIVTQSNRTFLTIRDHTSVPANSVDGPPMDIAAINPGGLSTAWLEVVVINRAVTSTISVGGISSGTTYDAHTPITDIIEDLLSPYLAPTLAGLSVNPGVNVEVGATVTLANASLSWTTDSNGAAPINMTITGAAGFAGASFPTTGTSGIVTADTGSTFTHATVATETWTFNADKPAGGAIGSKSDSIKWMNRLYYGNHTSAAILEPQIKILANTLKSGSAGSYVFGAAVGTYKWICVVDSEAQPTVFKDELTQLPVAMEAPITVALTNAHSISINLMCYRTTNVINGALTIVLT